MSLSYQKICQRPEIFQRLFGVNVKEFLLIVKKVEPQWEQKILASYKRPGRNFKLSLEDMILMLLLYYRTYTSQMFVGCLFGLDASRVCRLIRRLEPLLDSVMTISKCKKLSEKDVENLIIDATEQPIERPIRDQKPYYSGKKKRHTMKTEIRINLEGQIVQVSQSYPGSVHDFQIFKIEKPSPQTSQLLVDSGYQGIHQYHQNAKCPYKASKNKPLNEEQKAYNKALSRVRVKVENILGDIKTFKIMSDRYRNKRLRYNLKFNIIAGIVNLKNGFAAA